MPLPYDPSRRRSLGGGSPPPSHGPREAPPPPPPFQPRHMPPPSPPHLPSSASSLPGSAPRGPPTASPFASLRDLASHASHRPSGGMSISSILGGDEQRKPHTSPNATSIGALTPKTMPPPSPGRARSSSMREPGARGYRDASPSRQQFGSSARPPIASVGGDRHATEARSPYESSQLQHGFRAFQPPQPEPRPGMNGHGAPGRPTSQPVEQAAPRGFDNPQEHEEPYEDRMAVFRKFAEPQGPPYQRNALSARPEAGPFQNGDGPTSQPSDRDYQSPHMERQRSNTGPINFRPGAFGTPMREDQAGLFRPAYPPRLDGAREQLDGPRFAEMHREVPRSSPPLTDLERMRHGYMDRPMTLEEHQRMEAMHREQQQNRKESEGSVHRALLNISPELNRRGRNSPLPQAVQGAQPRHIGPGGDNPGIKMEFGRMFSGLGSGVGTATPTAGQSMNGTTTPSRMSPATHVEGGDLVRTAVAEIEGAKSRGRDVKKNGRHMEDDEQANGTETPDHQPATKRAKPNPGAHHHHHHHVHPHHHHHHHHEAIDNGPSPFNMLRFPSNNPQQPPAAPLPATAHHHHHHHTAHAHPGHHHHHVPRPAPTRKPTTTVNSRKLVEDAAKKHRNHLGSQLYTIEIEPAPASEIPADAKIKYTTRMKPIPVFTGKENCTYTVRIPRSFLGSAVHPGEKPNPEYFQEICRARNVWGTDVYTDDSDVLAAAVHSGWIRGDFGEYNDDLLQLAGDDTEINNDIGADTPLSLFTLPAKPARVPRDLDAHVTLLLLPPLTKYASTTQNHIWSREWSGLHDGTSYMIQRIDFVDEATGSRAIERSARARKARLRVEEEKREAAASLLDFSRQRGGGTVRVGA